MDSDLIINLIFLFLLLFACALIFIETKKIKKKEKIAKDNNRSYKRSSSVVSKILPEIISHTISDYVDVTLGVYGLNYSVYQSNILWYGLFFSLYDILKDHSLFTDTLDFYVNETASRYFPSEQFDKLQIALHGVFNDLTVFFSDFLIDRMIDHADIVFKIQHKNDFCRIVLNMAFENKYGEEVFISYRRSFLKLYESLSQALKITTHE